MSEADHHDSGKLRYDLIPVDALEAIVEAMTYGADKYDGRNWEKGTAWGRYFASLMRHAWAWWRGEDKDKETGLSHLAHAGACILFLLAYESRGIGNDDRSKH